MNIWKPEEDVMGCLPLLLSLYSLEMECLRKHETCFFQLGHWTRKLPEFSCLLYPLWCSRDVQIWLTLMHLLQI